MYRYSNGQISLADFSKITETVDAALRGEQIQPLLLR